MEITKLNTPQLMLGEGIVWKADTSSVLFVDIKGEAVYEQYLATGVLRKYEIGGAVGFLVIEDKENIICARNSDLVRLHLPSASIEALTDFGIENYLRFNDGKCDQDGRLWVGTMAKDGTEAKHQSGKGALLCIEDGCITGEITGMTIPNGMDWFDGFYYHVDTTTKKIYKYKQLKNKLTLIEVAVDLTQEPGGPDGFCIDSNGDIWVAMWGGFCVLHCNTSTGEIIERIMIPDRCVSCPTFGGENLDVLFVTTARDDDGQGGYVYSIKTSVKGREPNYILN